MQHYLRLDNKVNENKVLSYYKALRTIKNNEMLFSFMSNLQAYYNFKLDFQNVDQHTPRKWYNPRPETPQGQSVAKPGTPL